MPAKSGASHALAALVGLVVAAFLKDLLHAYAPPIADVTTRLGRLVVGVLGLSGDVEIAGALVLFVVLSFAWGTVYHVARH